MTKISVDNFSKHVINMATIPRYNMFTTVRSRYIGLAKNREIVVFAGMGILCSDNLMPSAETSTPQISINFLTHVFHRGMANIGAFLRTSRLLLPSYFGGTVISCFRGTGISSLVFSYGFFFYYTYYRF